MRRGSRRSALPGVFLALMAVGPLARAADPPSVDVRIEENTAVPRRFPQYVPVTVTIVDHTTQAPPTSDYNVYALARNGAGEQTQSSSCGQRSDNNPGTPRGIYDCTVIVDHGGAWTLLGVVNNVPVGKQPPLTLARVTTEVRVDGPALAGTAPNPVQVNGRVTDVAVLWVHSACALGWGVAVAALAMLAFPGLRRRLSALGVHRFEDRLDLMIRLLWGMTGLVILSGTYLLLKETAYKTPWSVTAARGVFRLPYGKPYFLALAVKLAAYAAMVTASLPLAREARRRSALRLDADAAPTPVRVDRHDRSPWDAPPRARGSAGTLVESRREAAPPIATARPAAAAGLVRMAGLVTVAGGLTIWLSVTLLKYYHELVEASRALLVR